MFDLHSLNQDSLSAELAYRREQLTGSSTTFPRPRVHRLRQRRSRTRAA